MRRLVVLVTLIAGIGVASAQADRAPFFWGWGDAPYPPDPPAAAYYEAVDSTGAVVAHAYKQAAVRLDLDAAGFDSHRLEATGRIFSYDAAQRSFVFSSSHATLYWIDDNTGIARRVCKNGKLIAGGDRDGRWVAEITFAHCPAMPGRQFIAARLEDGSYQTVTIDPLRR